MGCVKPLAAALGLALWAGAGPDRAWASGEPAPVPAETRWRSWTDWRLPSFGERTVFFPSGDIFAPPFADPKQPRFHATWQSYHTAFGDYRVGSVGFGENLGLARWPSGREGDGVQLGVSGAVLALFNMDSESHDLLNADYIIGFPLSWRRRHWSARARLFHQSSHLGDEFLLTSQPIALERINLSYEVLETLLSWDNHQFRVYGGPSRILSTVTPLKRQRVQAGAEYRSSPWLGRTGRWLAGVEWSAWQENRWQGNLGLKGGIVLASPFQEARSVQLYGEFYGGEIPHGQFYRLRTAYYGLGLAFSL
ncbi:MAG: hypothetical protein A2X36_04165 [Elusimicrobia bacterium GWA2_69_24]|nr:MAG: hypothetical protein A2X36_04165 [Elusimicrobia bacterium GWA2_69_24]HBL16158.1 hypothetical protein [Elusimicrobiota bacterium]